MRSLRWKREACNSCILAGNQYNKETTHNFNRYPILQGCHMGKVYGSREVFA